MEPGAVAMRSAFLSITMALAFSSFTATAHAEFQCAPSDATINFPVADTLFRNEVTAWSKTTAGRYLEGTGTCTDVVVPGYERFPTKRCSYETADAGEGVFDPLPAQVIVLNPSAQQLAAWSINACRANGAQDQSIISCSGEIRKHVVSSNGAQFPVAGSVVESYCNSSTRYGSCEDLDPTSEWRRPRHTWFRDGVSVDYNAAQGVRWTDVRYPPETFDAVLDTGLSDGNLDRAYDVARIAAVYREVWTNWRRSVARPLMPVGVEGTLVGHGWRKVASEVHKAACRSDTNELFNALVHGNPGWTR